MPTFGTSAFIIKYDSNLLMFTSYIFKFLVRFYCNYFMPTSYTYAFVVKSNCNSLPNFLWMCYNFLEGKICAQNWGEFAKCEF